MKILSFCEGTRPDTGGVGLTGVPLIHNSLAGRGHDDVLCIAGTPMASAEPMLVSSIESVFEADAGGNRSGRSGAIGAVPFSAIGKWYFSPDLYRAAVANIPRADFVSIHSVYSFPSFVGYALARRHNKPYGVWPHGVFAPVQRRVSRKKKWVYSQLLSRRMLEQASVLIYSAEGEREEARALGLSTPSVVIPHGIDARRFETLPARGAFREKYLASHDGPLVLYLGRLNIKKGIDLLVKAMARVVADIPNARLAIAGAGHPPAFVSQVKRWVDEAGIAQATVLTGLIDDREKLNAFADCDVFVLPSVAENFGFALFEAMASGVAVVCSDSLNYADEVRRNDAGIVVPRTPAYFADAVVSLIRDPQRAARCGSNGRMLAGNYSWEMCGARLDTLVRSIIAGTPPTTIAAGGRVV